MSYTYNQFVASLANRLAISNTSSQPFQTELPNIIDAAEQRIYREVDLADARIIDQSATLTSGSRTFVLPSSVGRFVVLEQLNIFTPSGSTPSNGNRVPLVPASRDTVDALWPSELVPGVPSVPEFYSQLTSQIYRVGPSPDAPYATECMGTARPTPLSNSNQTTLLTLYLPDLFFAAAMVIAAAYQKNFGAQADDPKMAMSWEQEYQLLVKSAIVEEFRKRFGGSAWSPMAAPPEAQPPRS